MNIEPPKSKQPIPPNAERVFRGKIFEVYQWDQKLYDGTTKRFEKIKRPASVMVLPVTDEGKIVVTEQEQPGEGVFYGLIGGIVDESEDILETARRELLEESGYEADEFLLWDATQLINKIEWSAYTFIAKRIKQIRPMSPDGGERIRLLSLSFDEFLILTHNERFRDLEIVTKVHRFENDPKMIAETRELFSL